MCVDRVCSKLGGLGGAAARRDRLHVVQKSKQMLPGLELFVRLSQRGVNRQAEEQRRLSAASIVDPMDR